MKSRFKRWMLLMQPPVLVLAVLRLRGPEEVQAYPAERVLRTTTLQGVPYALADDGNVLRCVGKNEAHGHGSIAFLIPKLLRNIVKEGDAVFRVDPDSATAINC